MTSNLFLLATLLAIILLLVACARGGEETAVS
jgi:hypothetical protein